jgi:type IX secretion system PorP/SprF family membrane protein
MKQRQNDIGSEILCKNNNLNLLCCQESKLNLFVLLSFKFQKTRMLKRFFVACVLIIVGSGLANDAFAQDPQFTQFYANPIYLNPAFAGSKRCPRVNMNYRNQWPGISGTFVTYSASFDMDVNALHGGIGGHFMADRAGEGTLNSFEGSLIYAYRMNISRKFSLRIGAQATVIQRSIDWEKLTFGDMIDPRYGFVYNTAEIQPNESKIFADFSAGIIGYTETFFIGFAAHHLSQPDEGFNGISKLPMKFTGHAGVNIYFGKRRGQDKKWNLSPNILYQQQQDFQQLNYGFYLSKGFIVGGLWFRQSFNNPDAFAALIGFQQGAFKFGYSYDVTVSSLTNNTAGSHEFSLGLQFGCKKPKKKFRAIDCPSF